MPPQRHKIPLDILPASLPQRRPVRCVNILGPADLVSYRIERPQNSSRIEIHPEKFCEKIRLHGFEIDFNADPLRRRSLFVRWKEWTHLTNACLMPEDPSDMLWAPRNPTIESPILPNLACVTRSSSHLFPGSRNMIAPTPKYKVASITAGIWFDATCITRDSVCQKTPGIELDPLLAIVTNNQLISNPFELESNSRKSVAIPILENVVLRKRQKRQVWQPIERLAPKTGNLAETGVTLSDFLSNSRRHSKSMSELSRLISICQTGCSSKTNSASIGTEFIEDLKFAMAPGFQCRIEKPVFTRHAWIDVPLVNTMRFMPLQPQLLSISVRGLKEFFLETYNTWFVQINRTDLRPRFQTRYPHPLTNVNWKRLQPPPDSFQSFLGAWKYHDTVSEIIGVILGIIETQRCSETFRHHSFELSFEPIALFTRYDGMIESVRNAELPCTTNPVLASSEMPVSVFGDGNQFENWTAIFQGTHKKSDWGDNKHGTTFFDKYDSEEDHMALVPKTTQSTATRRMECQLLFDNMSDESVSVGLASVKPDTPLEKQASQNSSETIDLTVEMGRNEHQIQDQNWSPTDDLFFNHMEKFDNEF